MESGVTFEQTEHFYSTLAIVSAEKLGSLALGWFKEAVLHTGCADIVWLLKKHQRHGIVIVI